MATATSTPAATSTAPQGGDDGLGGDNSSADLLNGDNLSSDGSGAAAAPVGASGGASSSGSAGTSSSSAADPLADERPISDPLKAERRRNNQLEKEIRTLRQQLNRFSEINPEEYARLQEAERQKQILEERMELRERQMEEASAQKVAAVAAERDEARAQVLQLRKDRLLERAFSQAEGRTGGDRRGTFFDIFKGQLGSCFRLATDKDGKDVLEPLDAQGKPLLGDDGRPLTTADFLEEMRVHPVYGFLFQQRGPSGMQAGSGHTVSGIGSNGEPLNPQAMSASELYRATFAVNGRSPARRA